MPTYKITSPDGRTLRLTGDSPPTEAELEQIFATTLTSEDLLNESQNFPPENPEAHKSAIAMEYISSMTGEQVNESNYEVLSQTLGYTGDTQIDYNKINSKLKSDVDKEENSLTGNIFRQLGSSANDAALSSTQGATRLASRASAQYAGFTMKDSPLARTRRSIAEVEASMRELRKEMLFMGGLEDIYNRKPREVDKLIAVMQPTPQDEWQKKRLRDLKIERLFLEKQKGEAGKTEALESLANDIGEYRQFSKDVYNVDEDFAESLLGKVVGVIGQMGFQIPASTVPGLGQFAITTQMFQQGYDDAIGSGATEDQAFEAGMLNAPGAILEYIGVKGITNAMFKGGGATASDVVKRAGKAYLEGGSKESMTEAGQTAWQNFTASVLSGYDEDRKITQDVFENMVVAFLGGGAISSAGATATAAQESLKSPSGIPYSEQETQALNEIISPEEQQRAIAQQKLNEDSKLMLTMDESPTTKQVVNQDEVATDEQIEQAAKENSGEITPIPVGAVQREVEGKNPAAIEKVEQDRERTEEIALNTTFGRSTRATPDDQLLLKDNGIAQAASDKFAITQQHIDRFIRPISSRIKAISPKIYGRLKSYELTESQKTSNRLKAVEPFLVGMKKLKRKSKKSYSDITVNLFSGNFETAQKEILKADNKYGVNLGETGKGVIDVLKEIHKEAKEVEYDIGYLENYFPRIVKDYRAIQRYFGKKPMGDIEQKIYAHEKKTGKKMDTWQREEFINNLVAGKTKGQGGMPNMKQRSIETVTPDMLKLYNTAEESLVSYIRIMTNNIEKQRIFGKPKKKKPKKGQLQLPAEDIDSLIGAEGTPDRSLGELLNDFINENDSSIEPDQQLLLLSMLQSRFDGGETTPHEISQAFRNIVYTGLLGNPFSAITQLEDLSISAYKNGIETVDGMVQRDITIDDIGLRDFIDADVSQARATSKILSAVLNISGFTAVDNFGKSTYLNATFQRLKRESDEFFDKQTAIYGKPFVAKLKKQLDADEVGAEVTQVLFNELSDIQPITRLEMPQVYLNNPNARVFYMFKSFLIKRMDLIRKEAFTEMRNGNPGKGVKNMMLMAFVFTLGHTSTMALKDYLLGRPIELDDYTWDNLLGLFGLSRYIIRTGAQKGPAEALEGLLMPPTRPIDEVFRDTIGIFQGTRQSFEDFRSVRYIPVAGKFLYWRWGHGAQKVKREQEKKGKEAKKSLVRE